MKKLIILPLAVITLLSASFINPGKNGNQPVPANQNEDSIFIVENYDKKEYQIPMRDGVKLFTIVYSPKDKSRKYPIMFFRTPYSVGPYGEGKYRNNLGPSKNFMKDFYIFAYQDVRGKFMSEGTYENMRLQIDNKKSKTEIDESSDTYDSVDWLVKNIPNNNGKVGEWGISYPGFYTAAASLSGHPALVAVSPQAPISDWWVGDDFHHNGAFFLGAAFDFMYVFGHPRPMPTTEWGKRFEFPVKDGYHFFLDYIGALKNIRDKYYGDTISFWKEMVEHPNYDDFWKARNLLPHLKNVKPAVMTVGGWFDAEDLYGPLQIYRAIEKNNPKTTNMLVMGPWSHGGWARTTGTKLGNVFFTENPPPSRFYQDSIEFSFFSYYLKGQGNMNLPEAYIFETGSNRWHRFDAWPPKNMEMVTLYVNEKGTLSFTEPQLTNSFDEFISDPMKPVPYTEEIATGMTKAYMTDDQRFAGRRTDVLVYQTEILKEDITLAGPLSVSLKVSTTGTDADWVVKLIDVYADDDPQSAYQQLVRGDVFRGRFRESFEKPKPFVSDEITEVKFEIPDICHTFKKGNRIMLQIQSTWFPLVDRNPQQYVENIFKANEEDFIKATHRVYHSKEHPTYIKIGRWKH